MKRELLEPLYESGANMNRSARVLFWAWLVLNLVPISPDAAPRSPVAPATIINPAISFATGYAHPSRYWGVGGPLPWINDTMTILGKVAAFQAPFDDLDATDPGVEFTYRISNLSVVEVGIWDDFARNEGGLGVSYENGLLEIYRDSSPDADFAHPSTFVDGEMLLTASISHFLLTLYSSQSPPQESFLRFTGGTLFDRVSSSEGQGFAARSHGDFDGETPVELRALGYNAMSSASIDINGGVAVEPSTWGGIKALMHESR